MNAIGGYFGLELDKGEHQYHTTPYYMNCGRSSLLLILNTVKPTLVHIPFYTCDTLLEPFLHTGVPYKYYCVNNQLDPVDILELGTNEYFLYINYFDLKRNTVKSLSNLYKDKLIIDCTQAFFMKNDGISWSFNSCRKFFGVPDGSYLYPPYGIELSVPETMKKKNIIDHLLCRFYGNIQEGYSYFLQNEVMIGKAYAGMSKITEYLLSHIDYDSIIKKRRDNYNFLHDGLAQYNFFSCIESLEATPMFYPLLLDRVIDKNLFYKEGIFVPSLWKDVMIRDLVGFEKEKFFSKCLLPIPNDHRYDISDMERVKEIIIKVINSAKYI